MRARKGDSLLYGAISALGKWLLVSPYPLMRSLGILWALQSGRTGRAPPRESPFGHPGSYPVRQSLFGELPAWRGGLRTPASETPLSPGDRPIRPPGVRLPLYDHVMRRLAYGIAMRTRRPRPFEKIAFRVIPGFSPVGPPTLRLASPRRGGLRTPGRKASR